MTETVSTEAVSVPDVTAAGVPEVPQGGFKVPPAGNPPTRTYVNGTAIDMMHTAPGSKPEANAKPETSQDVTQAVDDLSQVDLVSLVKSIVEGAAPSDTQVKTGNPNIPGWLGESANTFDTKSIENPTIRAMATVLQAAGKELDLDRVLGNALVHGDPSLVDIAYLAEKGGAQAPELTSIAKSIVDAVNAESNRITEEVHALAGGASQWAAAAASFNNTAPKELREVVALMLDSTSPSKIKAGAKLVAEFGKRSGALPQQGAPLLSTTAGHASAQGLSADAFKEELFKLNQNSPNFAQDRDNLFARRQLGRRAGL